MVEAPHSRRRIIRVVLALTLVIGLASCSGDDDEGAGADAEVATDVAGPYDGHTSEVYDGTDNWICHPDLADDECEPQPETVVSPDGEVTTRTVSAPEDDPPIDCFYVYPTVSLDPGVNSDLEPNENELATVRAQVARYQSVCRVFAPAYRQLTLNSIGTGGFGDEEARALAYGDVVDAWKTYVAQHNEGRGVVLIGHSQGSGHLKRLISDELDPNPELRDRLVSAILLGSTVTVPAGQDVGGDFAEVPACREGDQTGCVISYSSFPAASPPASGALFGRDGDAGRQALCVNPVELAGGNGLADAVVLREAPLVGSGGAELPGDTPYVVLPSALEARCEQANGYTVLLFSPASPADPRPIAGLLRQTLGPTWGLHLVDANLAQDDLIEVVRQQSEAFTADQ